jgi:hypothetical protein
MLGSANVIVDISVRFCATLGTIDFGLTRRAPGDWTVEDSNPRLSLWTARRACGLCDKERRRSYGYRYCKVV